MKQILSLILTFQLMVIPVVGVASSQEQQELNDPSKNTEVNIGSNASYDARSQSGNGYEIYAKQVLGASTAIIGANIISSCKWGAKVPSILTYMAGAIAYLVSEISGGKKQNEEHKARLKRIEEIKKMVAENQGGGDVQRTLIEQRLEEEEKLLEFTKKRNTWVKAIMAIYLTAAALAISEEMMGIAAGTAIGMSTCTGLAAKYASPCGKAYAACYAKHMAACTANHPVGQMTAKAAFMSPTSLETGETACTGLYVTACQANLKAYAAIAYANCQPLGAGNLTATAFGKTFTVNLYAAAFGAGFGYSSAGNLQTLLQLAVSLTNLFTNALAVKITALYSYPIPRSITFGAHAALMGVISGGLNEIEKQTEKNVKELRKVVSQFREHTDDSQGVKKGIPSSPSQSSPGEIKMESSTKVELAQKPKSLKAKENTVAQIKTCFSNKNDTMEVGPEACDDPVEVKPITVSAKQNKTENLESSVQLINDLNSSIKEGNLELAGDTSSKLASMATSLRKDLEKMQKDYNKNLPKEERIDFAAAIDKQLNELRNTKEAKKVFEDFEKELGMNLLASAAPSTEVGLDKEPNSEADKLAAEKANKAEEASLIVEAEAAMNLKHPSYAELYGTPEKMNEEDAILFGGDKTSNNPFGLNQDAYRAASANGYLPLQQKNNYVSAEGIADRQVNLFKVISNRYFLSYPKVMKRKTLAEGTME
ncbi:MAG TPA: hypothetical protein VKY27_05675 [Bacteriovoracaceae bacterium]|nr:hypothetical protein [Bacteriovoracaceae bacterium]